LARAGASVTIHGRDALRADTVASLAAASVGPWPPPAGSWDLLVNCTPLGMHPNVDTTPIPAPLLGGRIVYDLVYNPATTRLLREAAAAGCETIGGLDMLVAQAEEQFEMWTGARAPSGVMYAAAEARLKEFARDEAHVA
jgi:shikimate 5-dehydrogenase